ncbi:MAG: 50S ribosomal protein L2 [Alphaproteobacteria bacterium]
MSLIYYKPTPLSRRGLVLVDRKHLWKGRPEKALVEGLKRTGGRNASGRVTSWQRGGGHKRLYRHVDFQRRLFNVSGVVERLEYDPNRTCFIALVAYQNGEKSYILAPQKLNVGDEVVSGEKTDVKPGNAMYLKNMPIGISVHNIELKIGKGGQMARSAGASSQLVGKDMDYVLLKLPSGELRKVHGGCMASVGVLSNSDHQNIKLAKAGRNRWKGKRPHVRGVAMNPVDHPHGGGEGRTSGGRHPVSPWGLPTKGKKTRRSTRTDNLIIRRRHKA